MVMIAEMPAVARDFIEDLDIPEVTNVYWTPSVAGNDRRVSIVTTAGLSVRGDKPFSWHARDYRTINRCDRDLVMTHVAVDYDRTAWQQDINTVLPFDRLDEMASARDIGSVAEEHYSFMGASDPVDMEASAREVALRMREDNVNTVFLIPV